MHRLLQKYSRLLHYPPNCVSIAYSCKLRLQCAKQQIYSLLPVAQHEWELNSSYRMAVQIGNTLVLIVISVTHDSEPPFCCVDSQTDGLILPQAIYLVENTLSHIL